MAKKVKHYSYNPPKRRRVRIFGGVVISIVIVLAFITIVIRNAYISNLKPASTTSRSVLVSIPTGSSLPKIASLLKTNSVIKSAWAFEFYVRNDSYARSSLQAGTYIMHPNQDVQDIVTQLTEGKASGKLVVILPGQRIDQIETALINNGFPKAEVVAALNPTQYVSKYPMLANLPQSATLEGFLYPDSFAKDSSTTASTIVSESLNEMQNKLSLDIVNGFNKAGLTIYQGVTLASVVEQEVNNPVDQAKVAQVFLSRIAAGMNLGSDVTAYYGAIVAGQTPSVNYDSPYNTRLRPGLPQGPISNVSESSLNAVAHPASTNYLYFVTGDNGTTYFSTTLETHNQQAQQYCNKLCSTQ